MFCERLKYLRTEKELTQKTLATQLGLSANCICEWEKGRSEPCINLLKKLSQIFECSIDYLIGIEDDFGNVIIKEKNPATTLTQAEQDLLNDFRSVPRPEQAQIAEYAHYVANKHATSKQKPIKKNA